MMARQEATRGLLLVIAAVVALAFVVGNARQHFASITAESRFPAGKNAQNTSNASERFSIKLHAFDREPISNGRAIGAIDAVTFVRAGLHVQGWILTPSRTQGSHVVAIVDDVFRSEITPGYGRARPDVDRALGTESALHSGFDATFALPGIKNGAHRLKVAVARNADKALFSLNAETTFYIP